MKDSKVLFSDVKRKGSDNRERQDEPQKPATFRLSGLKNLTGGSQTSAGIALDPQSESDSIKDSEDISYQSIKNKDQIQPEEKTSELSTGRAVYRGDLQSLFNLESRKKDTTVEVKEREAAPAVGPQPKKTEEAPSGESEALRISFSEGEEHNQIYSGLGAYLQAVKAKVQNGNTFTLDPVFRIIFRVVERKDLLERIYPLTIPIHQGEDYNISHQVNTMIYALKIGAGFSYSARRLHELALGALFHDIGMFLIPAEITNKSGKLSAGDLTVIKKHPVLGRDILSAFEEYPWLAEVAYQHHERENGQGYPLGLKGDQISDYAKIIGIVDSYEAMTHNRSYRKALIQAFSAQELIKSKNLLFSPMVIKVFLKEISIYPLGSYVRLNNKVIGQVVGTDQTRPLRPDVRIIFDSEGNRVEEVIVLKLDENPIFFIEDSVAEQELSKR